VCDCAVIREVDDALVTERELAPSPARLISILAEPMNVPRPRRTARVNVCMCFLGFHLETILQDSSKVLDLSLIEKCNKNKNVNYDPIDWLGK
jgi:hypothetical protein